MKILKIVSCVVIPLILEASQFDEIKKRGSEAQSLGNLKKTQEIYCEYLKNPEIENVGLAKTQLVIAYYKDQDHEKSFNVFLEALADAAENKNINSLSDVALADYRHALNIYLEDAGLKPKMTAAKILEKFSDRYEKHKDNYGLGFLIAIAYANLEQYDYFFETFYRAYILCPTHYLVYKTKAALHVKLFERATSESQRSEHSAYIIQYAKQALTKQPHDTTLYRLIINFTPAQCKSECLNEYINRIIDQNIVVARHDIQYYNDLAITFLKFDLAQRFLDKARMWYSYSRVINEAQEYLNQQRTQAEG